MTQHITDFRTFGSWIHYAKAMWDEVGFLRCDDSVVLKSRSK